MQHGTSTHADGFDDETAPLSDGVVRFTRKHVFSTKNNPLCGIVFSKWAHLLFDNFQYVEMMYYPRLIFITLLSIFNSLLAVVELFLFHEQISKVELPDDPVFIIGHPRTGTTLLHNLISSDSDNFFYCTTFCAGFPFSFIWFERIGKMLFSGILDPTRPMDSMPLHFDLPQEDELATCLLSGGMSYYMPIWFMQQEPLFRRYLDFSPSDGAHPDDESKWSDAFLYLMKKLCLRHQMLKRTSDYKSQRLLLKSPVHTARVPLLRRLFPRAKFVYIHRAPEQVFLSAVHMADTTYWYCYMNTPTNEQVMEYILWQFEHMWRKYDAAATLNTTDRALETSRSIQPDILEVSYASLVQDSVRTLKLVYEHIGVDWTETLHEHFALEHEALKRYEPNKHVAMSASLTSLIRKRWSDYCNTYGY
ncbi:unnamed protein product [Ectocarpus fasciculatus]